MSLQPVVTPEFAVKSGMCAMYVCECKCMRVFIHRTILRTKLIAYPVYTDARNEIHRIRCICIFAICILII